MRGFPLSQRDYAAALAQVEVDAERSITEDKVRAGFEFVAMMEVGGEIRRYRKWHRIDAIVPANFGDLRLVTLDDGRLVKTQPLAMFRYRKSAEGVQ